MANFLFSHNGHFGLEGGYPGGYPPSSYGVRPFYYFPGALPKPPPMRRPRKRTPHPPTACREIVQTPPPPARLHVNVAPQTGTLGCRRLVGLGLLALLWALPLGRKVTAQKMTAQGPGRACGELVPLITAFCCRLLPVFPA